MFLPQENKALARRTDCIPFSRGVETFQPIVDGIIVEPDLDSADTYGQLPRSVADEIG
jgi:hypothetical protein